MSESTELLAEIRSKLRGRTLLLGRKIGQGKFDILGATLTVEAKPQEYPTGGNVIAWKTGPDNGDPSSTLNHWCVREPAGFFGVNVEAPSPLNRQNAP